MNRAYEEGLAFLFDRGSLSNDEILKLINDVTEGEPLGFEDWMIEEGFSYDTIGRTMCYINNK